jgi:hypothetical protein
MTVMNGRQGNDTNAQIWGIYELLELCCRLYVASLPVRDFQIA